MNRETKLACGAMVAAWTAAFLFAIQVGPPDQFLNIWLAIMTIMLTVGGGISAVAAMLCAMDD